MKKVGKSLRLHRSTQARKRRKLTKNIIEGVTTRRWGRLRKLRKKK
jgi:hypothetical protein